ncbi:hypothetical protein LSTR_LSTR001360 [Laodelphax striatellus]|uniref:Odorant receptor n=1 Tax=Laodelphax striatellus TaxID=195883 RepID=A0A482X9C5_LAOST|nr:hypothetical protein LSTR_LSTR001360 [Laodelphax striatellus]
MYKRCWQSDYNESDAETLGENSLFHVCIRECLKKNIQHHIEIIRFWEISKESWESVLRGLKKTRIKCLIFSGLVFSPEQPWRTFNLIVISISTSIMMFFAIIGTVSIYYARNDLLTLVEITHAYVFIVSVWVLTSFHFTTKIPRMYQILQIIDTGSFTYRTVYGSEDDEKIKTNMRKYAILFQNTFHAAIAITVFSFLIFSPLLNNMIGDGRRVKVKEINYKLPVPFWFPFNADTRTWFAVAFLLESGEIIVVAFYIGVMLTFIVCIALEVGAQFKILHNSILNIQPRAVEMYKSCWQSDDNESDAETLGEDPLFHVCIRECLKENIQHHIEIIRFFKLLQNVITALLGASTAAATTSLGCLSLVLTKSKQIPKALYECPWFKLLREQEKKTLIIYQINTGKNLVLKGGGLFAIDLQFFVQIVRTTYSIFNIFSTRED